MSKCHNTLLHFIANDRLLRSSSVSSTSSNKPPDIVFIVPYRDREQQMIFFKRQMEHLLEDVKKDMNCDIYFLHQCDERQFNRGAMKNIGFLVIKEKYPDNYKNITLVFNDVDIMPLNKNFINYNTVTNNVKHYYGFMNTLGGIVSIKAGDFEKTGGFPNYWAWGYEDNMFQKRVHDAGLTIDRTNFYGVSDKNFIHLHDGITRTVNKTEFHRYEKNVNEGFYSIKNINYEIDENTGFVNVYEFNTGFVANTQFDRSFDLRNGSRPFNNTRNHGSMKLQLGL